MAVARGTRRGRDERLDVELLEARLAREGFVVLRGVVPARAVDAALRRLHLEILRCGLAAAQIEDWHRTKCWFPHLRFEPEIVALADHLPPAFRSGTPCEPQLLLHLPDEADEWPLTPHVDEPPPWANGSPYSTIVGVALSPGHRDNGGLVVWPLSTGDPLALRLEPGDAVVMHPRLPHSGGLNRSGAIRYAVYFRYLAPPRGTDGT